MACPDRLPIARVSSLPSLAACPGFRMLREATERTTGRAADSGSMVGRIVEHWHKGGETADAFEAAVSGAMAEMPARFPAADPDEARTWALKYAADPRNRGVVVGEWCEEEVRYTLPADEDDPDQTPHELVGHVDQIRRDPHTGLFRVWDLKSGKDDGLKLLCTHAWQLAAYALAATATLGVTVLPGGIFRLRGYDVKKRTEGAPADVLFEAPWSLEECKTMMSTVAFDLGLERRGLIALRPGAHCTYCPAGSPAVCGRRIDELLNAGAMSEAVAA